MKILDDVLKGGGTIIVIPYNPNIDPEVIMFPDNPKGYACINTLDLIECVRGAKNERMKRINEAAKKFFQQKHC